jgi:flagellar hook-associated protein 3 FlgL
MTMRVPNLLNNAQAQLDLQRVKQSFAQTVQQVSSGQAIVDIGDDPSGTSQILGYQADISQNAQYISQANTANSYLTSTSTVLTTMGNDLNSLMSLAQEGLGSGATASSQDAIATQVTALRSDLISLGNTQEQGRYIFAGTNTTQQPFDPATGAYSGNDGSISLAVSQTASVVTNVPGDTLFFGGPGGQGGDGDLLAQAANLSTALQANDTAGIQTAYNNLQAISNRVNTIVAGVGGRQNGIQAVQSGLTSFNNTLTTQESSIASVDYPTAITQLSQESVAEQATLSVMSQSNQKTLFDYLG